MVIDFSKAIEGEFYEFADTVKLDDELLDNRGGKFISEAALKGWYVLNDGCLSVKCEVEIEAIFACDRCLAETVLPLKAVVSESFFKETDGDETLKTYTDDKIELLPFVEERVILAIPSRVLCKEDCKGLCPKCGKNLNEGSCECDTDIPQYDNRFAALLDMNITSGGNKNGSTKK